MNAVFSLRNRMRLHSTKKKQKKPYPCGYNFSANLLYPYDFYPFPPKPVKTRFACFAAYFTFSTRMEPSIPATSSGPAIRVPSN